MKIACIAASKIPSLTANSLQVMKACQALRQSGHDVTLLVPGTGQSSWDSLRDHYGLQMAFKIEWLPANPSLKRYDFSLAAVRRARALGADILYTWPPQAALLGLVQRMPVILELHGEPEGKLGPLVFRLILRQKAPKRFLAITRALVGLIESRFGFQFAPGTMVIAPNGIDPQRFTDLPSPPEARRRLGLPEGFTAAHTGHLYAGRGANLLFTLAQRCPEVNFLWVGGTPDAVGEWQARLDTAGVQNVTLTGFVENARLPLFQSAAEVLLMPYERQISGSSGGNSAAYASPMKMFEYLACGRVILASDLAVIREVLNEHNAVLLPPDDADAWAERLDDIHQAPDRWQALAETARRDAGQYTWIERARRALEGFDANQA